MWRWGNGYKCEREFENKGRRTNGEENTSICDINSGCSIWEILASSWKSSIKQSIRFMSAFTRLVSVVGDNSCEGDQKSKATVVK